MIEIDKFPTATDVKAMAEARATENKENKLRDIFENSIEPAIKNGQAYCEYNAWNLTEDVVDFLKGKGYVVDYTYRNTRGNVIISWGSIDIKTLWPENLPTEEENA